MKNNTSVLNRSKVSSKAGKENSSQNSINRKSIPMDSSLLETRKSVQGQIKPLAYEVEYKVDKSQTRFGESSLIREAASALEFVTKNRDEVERENRDIKLKNESLVKTVESMKGRVDELTRFLNSAEYEKTALLQENDMLKEELGLPNTLRRSGSKTKLISKSSQECFVKPSNVSGLNMSGYTHPVEASSSMHASRSMIPEYESMIEQLQMQVGQLTGQLHDCRHLNHSLATDMTALHAALADAKDARAHQESISQNHMSELVALRQRTVELEGILATENVNWTESHQRLQAEVDAYKKICSEIANSNSANSAAVSAQILELQSKWRQSVEALTTEKSHRCVLDAKLKVTNDAHTSLVQTLELQVASLEEQLKSQRAYAEEAKTASHEQLATLTQSIAQERAAFESKKYELESRWLTLKTQHESLVQSSKREKETLENEISSLRTELSSTNGTLLKMAEDSYNNRELLADLADAREKISDLTHQVAHEREQCASLQRDNKSLSAAVASLNHRLQETEHAAETTEEELTEQIQTLQERVGVLQQVETEWKYHANSMARDMETLKTTHDEELVRCEKALSESGKALSDAATSYEAIVSERDTLRDQMESSINAVKASFKQEVASLKEEKNSFREQVGMVEEELLQVREALDKEKSKRESMKATYTGLIEGLELELRLKLDAIDVASKANSEQGHKLSVVTSQNASLQAQLTDALAGVTMLKSEVQSLTKAVHTEKEHAQSLVEQKASRDNLIQQLYAEMAAMQSNHSGQNAELKSQLNAKEQNIHDLSQSITQLQSSLAETNKLLSEAKSVHEEDVRRMSEVIDELESTVQSDRHRIATKEAEFDALYRSQQESHEVEKAESVRHIAELNEKLTSAQKKAAADQAALSKLKDECVSLTEANKKLQAGYNELESQLFGQKMTLESEVQSLTHQLADLRASSATSIDQIRIQSSTREQQLYTQLHGLENQLAQQVLQVTSLTEQKRQLEEELQSTSQNVTKSTTSLLGVESRLSEQIRLVSELNEQKLQLQHQLDEATRKVSELQQSVRDSATDLERIGDLEKVNHSLQQQLIESQSEAATHSARVAQLQEELATVLQAAGEEEVAFRAQIRHLQETIRNDEAVLQEKNQLVSELQRSVSAAHSEIDLLANSHKLKMNVLKNELASAEAMWKSSQAHSSSTESALSQLQAELSSSQTSAMTMRDEYEAAINSLSIERADLQNTVISQQEKLKALSEGSELDQRRIAVLQKQLDMLEDQMTNDASTYQERIQSLQQKLDSAVAATQQLQMESEERAGSQTEKISELQEQLRQTSSELNSAVFEIQSLQSQLDVVSNELTASRDLHSKELETARSQYNSICNDLAQCKAKLDEARNQLSSSADTQSQEVVSLTNQLATLHRAITTESASWIDKEAQWTAREQSLSEQIEQWAQREETISKQLDVANAQVAQLTNDLEQSKQELQAELAKKESIASSLNSQLQQVQLLSGSRIKAFEDRVSTMTQEIEQANALMAVERSQHEAQIQSLSLEVEKVNQMLSSQQSSYEDNIDDLNRQIATLQRASESEKQLFEQKEAELNARLNSLKQEVSAQLAHIQQLQSGLDESKTDKEQLHTRLAEVSRALEHAEKAMSDLKQVHDAHVGQMSQRLEEAQLLLDIERNQYQKQVNQFTAQLEQVHEEFTREKSVLESRYMSLNEQVVVLKHEKESIRSELIQTQERLSIETVTFSSQKEQYEMRLSESSKQLTLSQDFLVSSKQKTKSQVRELMNNLKTLQDAALEEKARHEEKVHDLKNQLKSMHESSTEQKNQLVAHITDLNLVFSKLKSKLQVLHDENSSLSKQLRALRREMMKPSRQSIGTSKSSKQVQITEPDIDENEVAKPSGDPISPATKSSKSIARGSSKGSKSHHASPNSSSDDADNSENISPANKGLRRVSSHVQSKSGSKNSLGSDFESSSSSQVNSDILDEPTTEQVLSSTDNGNMVSLEQQQYYDQLEQSYQELKDKFDSVNLRISALECDNAVLESEIALAREMNSLRPNRHRKNSNAAPAAVDLSMQSHLSPEAYQHLEASRSLNSSRVYPAGQFEEIKFHMNMPAEMKDSKDFGKAINKLITSELQASKKEAMQLLSRSNSRHAGHDDNASESGSNYSFSGGADEVNTSQSSQILRKSLPKSLFLNLARPFSSLLGSGTEQQLSTARSGVDTLNMNSSRTHTGRSLSTSRGRDAPSSTAGWNKQRSMSVPPSGSRPAFTETIME